MNQHNNHPSRPGSPLPPKVLTDLARRHNNNNNNNSHSHAQSHYRNLNNNYSNVPRAVDRKASTASSVGGRSVASSVKGHTYNNNNNNNNNVNNNNNNNHNHKQQQNHGNTRSQTQSKTNFGGNKDQRPKSGGNNNNNTSANVTTAPSKAGVQNHVSSVVVPKPKTLPNPLSQSPSRYGHSSSLVALERSRNFRAFIEKAIHDHKVFSCTGVYPAIRAALKKRGWVEKPGPLAYSRSANATKSDNRADELEYLRLLKDYQPDFIWVIRRDNIDWRGMTKDQLINRFPKAWFTTKVGLAACLQHMHWFSEAGISDTFFPRCYRLCLEEERQAFQDDFRLTACMSYLRYIVDTFERKGHVALADVHSKITPLSVDFASRQLGNYIRMRRHEDIDWLLPPNFMTQHWDAFIHQYYAVVHEKRRLRFEGPEAVHVKYEAAKKMLHKVAPYWPQMQLDGVYNMWICKPGARSRGKGIVIMNNLEKIMDLMTQSNFRECNWVVQKYIEKPMLIYKTKFDIRQWFLITDWTPLTVWFYKESYVRFCTKPFVLENFHESIHLCNNAIQCRYQNAEQRDSNLPDENMWSSDTFQAYLKTIGRLDAWPLIYSKMKQAIVGVLLASQENVESKRGCYELYGADFMLTEDFQPWLIEINSCPCMAASTSVTARMCAQCLEDTIKVVVDRRTNKNANTGMFEMIYRQNAGSVAVQQFSGHDLTIIGKKLTRDIDWPMTMTPSKPVLNVTSKHTKSNLIIPQRTNSTLGSSSTNQNNNVNNIVGASASPSVSNTREIKELPPNNINNNATTNGPPTSKQTLAELLQKLRVRNQEMFQGVLASKKLESANDGPKSQAQSSSPRVVPPAASTHGGNTEPTGTTTKLPQNPNSTLYEMMYRQSASSFGIQNSGQDLTIVGKKLTGDVDALPMMMSSRSNTNLDKSPSKYLVNDKENDLPLENKPTLAELLQKLRVRNKEVFNGAMALE